jgi:hypothetical protein
VNECGLLISFSYSVGNPMGRIDLVRLVINRYEVRETESHYEEYIYEESSRLHYAPISVAIANTVNVCIFDPERSTSTFFTNLDGISLIQLKFRRLSFSG